jgi:hypothetical protein
MARKPSLDLFPSASLARAEEFARRNSKPLKLTVGPNGRHSIELPVKPSRSALLQSVPKAEDDPPLNELRHFQLAPDNRSPLEFVGKLVARAASIRDGNRKRTWIGIHETHGGKFVLELFKWDGTARNLAWEHGEQSSTVRLYDTLDAALDSIRSPALKHQLLKDLCRESVEFIE